MSLNFTKSLFFIPKLLKKFFFHPYFYLYTIQKNSLQSLEIEKELLKVQG